MKFHSISRPPKLKEAHKNSGEIIVDTGGLQTLQQRVEIYRLSGLRLEAQRYLETFDVADDGSDLLIPRARRPGYDIIDAQNDLDSLRDKYIATRQARYEAQQIKQKQLQDDLRKGEIAAAIAADRENQKKEKKE